MKKTTNYKLNKPEATDNYNIENENDNMDIIDTKLNELEKGEQLLTVSDSTSPSTSTNEGKLSAIINWFANMIKAITGGTTWKEAPSTTLKATKAHMDDNTVHITSTERTGWNNKASTTLATAKEAGLMPAADKKMIDEATSTPAANKLMKYDANGKTPLDAATKSEIGEKLNKVDPYYGGILASWDGESTGNTYTKYLGSKVSISASPHQKMDILFPVNGFNGWLDISVTGNWGNTNASGNVTKRFAINLSPSGVINSQHSKYIEAVGSIASYVSIGDMFYDSVRKAFIVKVSYRATALGGSESLAVKLDGMGITGLTMMKGTSITAFYPDTEVYPLPIITYLNQVAFKALQGVSPFTVDSTTEVDKLNVKYVGGFSQDQLRKNAINNINNGSNLNNFTSEGEYFTTSSAIAATVVNSPTTNSFNLEVKKTTGSWVTQIVTDLLNNIYIRRYNGDLVSWGGWTKLPLPDGTLQTNLNAERVNGIKMFNSLTTPVGAANGDLYFPPPTT